MVYCLLVGKLAVLDVSQLGMASLEFVNECDGGVAFVSVQLEEVSLDRALLCHALVPKAGHDCVELVGDLS